MQRPVLVTPPAQKPVTLAEVKARLRIAHTDEDADLNALIATATALLDGYNGLLGRALITQTWALSRSEFPASSMQAIRLPLAPVQSITSIHYRASGIADPVPFANTSWRLVDAVTGPQIEVNDGVVWPSTSTRPDAVTVTFVAGYGDTSADIPEPIRQAILTMVADFYGNRESFARGATQAVPSMVPPRALLMAYKRTFMGMS